MLKLDQNAPVSLTMYEQNAMKLGKKKGSKKVNY